MVVVQHSGTNAIKTKVIGTKEEPIVHASVPMFKTNKKMQIKTKYDSNKSAEVNHATAAKLLLKKIKWQGNIVQGWIKDELSLIGNECVFVFYENTLDN